MADQDPMDTDEKAPAPQWEYRKNLKLHDRMKHVVGLTIDATKSEITTLRRKIDRLTYGS